MPIAGMITGQATKDFCDISGFDSCRIFAGIEIVFWSAFVILVGWRLWKNW